MVSALFLASLGRALARHGADMTPEEFMAILAEAVEPAEATADSEGQSDPAACGEGAPSA